MKEVNNQSLHFFVVDDDRDDQHFFEKTIRDVSPNINVTCFSDGTEVMKCLYDREIIPDLIFLDLKMHKQGGEETLVLIKQNEFFFHIPIIILTSNTNVTEKETLTQIGANAYFVKPDNTLGMKKIVEKALKNLI